jgi:hypothetical protein
MVDLSLISLEVCHPLMVSRSRWSFLISFFKSTSYFSFWFGVVALLSLSRVSWKISSPSETFFKVLSISARKRMVSHSPAIITQVLLCSFFEAIERLEFDNYTPVYSICRLMDLILKDLDPRESYLKWFAAHPDTLPSGRHVEQLPQLSVVPSLITHANGSAMVKFGDTVVVCSVKCEVVEHDSLNDMKDYLGRAFRYLCIFFMLTVQSLTSSLLRERVLMSRMRHRPRPHKS